MRKVLLGLFLVFLTSCNFPPPEPLKDGSCPGRVLNFRETPIGISIFRQEVGKENFHVGFNVSAKASSLVSLPAGKFAVQIADNNGRYIGTLEILVAIEGSTTFVLEPQLDIAKSEIVYWWVSQK